MTAFGALVGSEHEQPPPHQAASSSRLVPERVAPRAFCAICLEPFRFGDEDCNIAALPCQHVFHYDCIEKWYDPNGCPKCRSTDGLPPKKSGRGRKPKKPAQLQLLKLKFDVQDSGSPDGSDDSSETPEDKLIVGSIKKRKHDDPTTLDLQSSSQPLLPRDSQRRPGVTPLTFNARNPVDRCDDHRLRKSPKTYGECYSANSHDSFGRMTQPHINSNVVSSNRPPFSAAVFPQTRSPWFCRMNQPCQPSFQQSPSWPSQYQRSFSWHMTPEASSPQTPGLCPLHFAQNASPGSSHSPHLSAGYGTNQMFTYPTSFNAHLQRQSEFGSSRDVVMHPQFSQELCESSSPEPNTGSVGNLQTASNQCQRPN